MTCSMKLLGLLLFATTCMARRNMGRQLVAPSSASADPRLPFRQQFEDGSPAEAFANDAFANINSIDDATIIEPASNKEEDVLLVEEAEGGFLDTFLGGGAQGRIVERVSDWVVSRAKENPGCVERFVCETYRTGQTLSGIPYLMMTVTNAAVSFMVAEMFDKSVDINEITRAARYGRTVGNCYSMECDFLDNQLRTVGDYLGTFEEFLTQIINSISSSLDFGIGKK